jgi:hypothetical protein
MHFFSDESGLGASERPSCPPVGLTFVRSGPGSLGKRSREEETAATCRRIIKTPVLRGSVSSRGLPQRR